MMEFIRFIFSSFWIWLGFVTLVAVMLKYLVDLVKAIRSKRNIKVYNFGDRQTVEIENATDKDVAAAVTKSEF